MEISENIKYTGVFDKKTDLFEGQYHIPDGISYNSYIIFDEKITVTDTADKSFANEWIDNVKKALGEKNPEYLVVHHMEPDHSASIADFIREYPDVCVIASSKAFAMIDAFFGSALNFKRLPVSDGDTVSLGKGTLTFYTAPMVHWPEVIVSYYDVDKALFSADGFGKFGSSDSVDKSWSEEARRYYIGIVGKYGPQVQALLKKLSSVDISLICPLHGPVIGKNDISECIEIYDKWSTYTPEEDGIFIGYTSVYGNTKKAVLYLAEKLEKSGKKIAVYDLARSDMSLAVSEAFRYSHLVLATTTYNSDIFPFMREFINHLTERNFKNRTVALIENGSWAPVAAKLMRDKFEKSSGIVFCENSVKIMSAPNDASFSALDALAEELLGSVGK